MNFSPKNSFSNKFFILLTALFLNITLVSAQNPEKITFLTEDTELILEIIIAILAIIAAVIALMARSLVKGGQLEKGINSFVIAVIVFAILEVYQIVKVFIISISGLGDILELVFVIFLILGFYQIRNALR